MIVITLSKVPPALRGVLTKWYQEIQTGVYVGNVSARVRDKVWERITRDIGPGVATMVYNAANEFGYTFKTTRVDYQVGDYDGIPLMVHLNASPVKPKLGFSNASKYHEARKHRHLKGQVSAKPIESKQFAVLDLETTGLDPTQDEILSIGIVKQGQLTSEQSLEIFVNGNQKIKPTIQQLTGITSEYLKENGVLISDAIAEFKDFVGELPILGYNVNFDEKFVRVAFEYSNLEQMSNRFIDILPMIKKDNQFLDNYHLSTVLSAYKIDNPTPHHALADAMSTYQLALKLMQNQRLRI